MTDQVTEQLREIMGTAEQEVQPEVVEPVEAVEAVEPADDVAAADDGTETIVEPDDIKTIAELAEAIDVEPSYLYEMQIGMGDNEEPVQLGELKDRYQSMLRDNAGLQEKVNGQAELIAKAEQGMSMGNQMSAEMTQAVGHLNEVQRQYQSTDWKALENEDPGNAALLRQKFQEAHTQAQGQIQQVKANQDALQSQYLQHAGQKLQQMIPEWGVKEVRESEQAGIRKMMIEAGYNEQLLNNVSDPIAVTLARELYLLKKERATAQGNVERVRKAPRVLGGGRANVPANKQLKELVDKAKNSRGGKSHKQDEFAAVKALMKAG